MRVMVVHPGPHFSVNDVYVGWVEALRQLGQQVSIFNMNDRLVFYESALIEVEDGKFKRALDVEQAEELTVHSLCGSLYKTRPDVMLVISAFFTPKELMDLARWYGTKVVVIHTESPYEDERQLEKAAHADLNLINDPTHIDLFRAKAPTVYMPHAYRPNVHHPGIAVENMICDFAFVGTGFQSRIDFFERMDLVGLDVLLAGYWKMLNEDSKLREYVCHAFDECFDNLDAANVYRSARVGINLYRREADKAHLVKGWSMGPREVEMAACGMFFLRDPRPEGDEVFPMLPTFTTPEEASDLVRYYLKRDAERKELAMKARDAVADRTFLNNARSLLRLLEKQKE